MESLYQDNDNLIACEKSTLRLGKDPIEQGSYGSIYPLKFVCPSHDPFAIQSVRNKENWLIQNLQENTIPPPMQAIPLGKAVTVVSSNDYVIKIPLEFEDTKVVPFTEDQLKELGTIHLKHCTPKNNSIRNIITPIGITDMCASGSRLMSLFFIRAKESLKQRMKRLKSNNQALTLDNIICVAYDIGRALFHTHEYGVCHRDVSSDNILCFTIPSTEDEGYYLSDYGLGQYYPMRKDSKGYKLRYRPPEVLLGEADTLKSDVWAFGVLLLELLFGQMPAHFCASNESIHFARLCSLILDYEQIKNLRSLYGINTSGFAAFSFAYDYYHYNSQISSVKLKDIFPTNTNPVISNIITNCLRFEAENRPTMAEVLNELTLSFSNYHTPFFRATENWYNVYQQKRDIPFRMTAKRVAETCKFIAEMDEELRVLNRLEITPSMQLRVVLTALSYFDQVYTARDLPFDLDATTLSAVCHHVATVTQNANYETDLYSYSQLNMELSSTGRMQKIYWNLLSRAVLYPATVWHYVDLLQEWDWNLCEKAYSFFISLHTMEDKIDFDEKPLLRYSFGIMQYLDLPGAFPSVQM